jgi:hypothetical protein
VTALRQEETEVVQSLLEVTLHYEMRHNYTYTLREFFDLRCKFFFTDCIMELVCTQTDMYVVFCTVV